MHKAILVLWYFFSFCSNVYAQEKGSQFELLKIGNSEGVIVNKEAAEPWRNLLEGILGKADFDYWTPAKEDVLKAETLYVNERVSKGAEIKEIEKNLDSYIRQYVGILVHGKRKIYLNFVANWAKEDDKWKSEPATPVLLGGGVYHFQVVYDVGTETFSNLFITDGGPE